MKSNKTKCLLLIILLCSLLALLSSCRKNTDGNESSSIAQSLISSERSSLQPVVVVPSPSSSRKAQEESEAAAQAEVKAESAETAGSVNAAATENAGTESSVPLVIDSSLSQSASAGSESSTPRVPAAPVFKSVTNEIVEVEDVIEPVFEDIFSYRGIESTLTAYTDNAIITIPAGTTGEDIAAAASLLLETYPYLSVVTYSVSDGVVTLSYPEQKEEDIVWFAKVLESDAKWYIDRIFESLSAPQAEVAKTEEENGHTFTVTEESPVTEEKTAETIVEETPVTKKGSFIKAYSVSVSDTVYMSIQPSKAFNMLSADVLLSFTDKFSAGVKVGYDFGRYLSLEAEVKYNFTDNVYLIGGVGYRFGFAESKKNSSVLISLGVGYELNVSDNIDFFIEGGLMYLPTGYGKFNPAVTFGMRYTF
jgi:hypothetical protein